MSSLSDLLATVGRTLWGACRVMIHPNEICVTFSFKVPYVSHQEELEPEAPKSGKSVEQHKSFAQGHAGL